MKQTNSAETGQAASAARADRQIWMLEPQSSATTGQFVFACSVVGGIVLGTSVLYALTGAWQVLPVSLIELVVFGGLCWLYTKRERRYDCIELFDGTLIVLRADTGHVERTELNPLWTQVTLGAGRDPDIEIRYAGATITVGARVPLEQRRRVVSELSQQLAALRS